ncbi:MAG: metal-sensing transcriptional repressor [Campylobacteraceae bacterium]
MSHSPAERKKLQNRINRISGQVNALKELINDESKKIDDPFELVRQMAAVKGAVHSMMMAFLESYAKGHMIEEIRTRSDVDAQVYLDNFLETFNVFGK